MFSNFPDSESGEAIVVITCALNERSGGGARAVSQPELHHLLKKNEPSPDESL